MAEVGPLGAFPDWSKDSQIFTFDFSNRRSKQLTAGAGTVNIDPEWFDPSVLPVHPNPKLLTTMWGKVSARPLDYVVTNDLSQWDIRFYCVYTFSGYTRAMENSDGR